MNSKDLGAKLAHMESRVDHLEAELIHLNELLTQCGFEEGIETLKMAAGELIAELQAS